MKTSTVDTLIWVLVYGGLIGVGLGLSVQRSDNGLGLGLVIGGGVAAAIGFALIYLRSRMNETPLNKDTTS